MPVTVVQALFPVVATATVLVTLAALVCLTRRGSAVAGPRGGRAPLHPQQDPAVVPDPGPGEAVVTVGACGVCHTDLHYREGGINDEFPLLLGHEAAGVVETVGE